MGAFGIQFGKKEDINKPIIGKLYAYELKLEGNTLIKSNEIVEYEVTEIIEDNSGNLIYLTNKWNESFDDIQAVPSAMVKEYIEL